MNNQIVAILEDRLNSFGKDIVIRPSVYRKKESEWSRRIVPLPGESPDNCLKRIFNLTACDWQKYYHQATDGEGHESKNILKLHSSALLSLLCFHNVSHQPIMIEGVIYNKAWFEVQNKVYDRPSSIDVVLQAENGDLLFLESKFTEYFASSKPNISDSYLNFYKTILKLIPNCPLEIIYPHRFKRDKKYVTGLTIKQNILKHPTYLDGIKQCFSHLIGMCQGPSNSNDDCWRNVNKSTCLSFATIVYPHPHEAFNNYCELYRKSIGKITSEMLRQCFNEKSYAGQIKVIDHILNYHDIFNSSENLQVLSTEIRKFYGF